MHANEPTSKPPRELAVAFRTLTPERLREWDATLAALDARARFLCGPWLDLLSSSYGFEPHLLVLNEGETVAAALPFVVVRSPFTGTRAVSLPFFDICRPYAARAELVQSLYDQFVRIGKRAGWDYLELRGDVDTLDVSEPSLSFYNHVVDLRGGRDRVFENMASSTRRAIRKAEKSGVVVQRSQDFSAIRDFYRLQCLTRKRHGLPPQPFKFFKNLHEQFIANESGSIFSAYYDGRIVASSVYLVQDDIVHYKYGASDVRFQSARCNNLVMWEAAAYYAELGYVKLDLGRNSLDNHGLRKYKLSWGAEEKITHYHRYDLKRDRIVKMTDDVYGWHNKIFARLPRPLAQLAGSLLYRHIA